MQTWHTASLLDPKSSFLIPKKGFALVQSFSRWTLAFAVGFNSALKVFLEREAIKKTDTDNQDMDLQCFRF